MTAQVLAVIAQLLAHIPFFLGKVVTDVVAAMADGKVTDEEVTQVVEDVDPDGELIRIKVKGIDVVSSEAEKALLHGFTLVIADVVRALRS